MKALKTVLDLGLRNVLFWVSRHIDYPLVPPDSIQVNFTFRCNLRCKMCSMHDHMVELVNKGVRIEIDTETFKKIIREAAELGIKSIIFIGGEPLLREDLFELIRFAKSFGMNTVMITNGVLLEGAYVDECFRSKLDCVAVSIDAATENTLSRIRGPGVLGRIVENVERINGIKKARNSAQPAVTAICTIMNENVEELFDIVLLCHRIGAGNVSFQPVVRNNVDQSDSRGSGGLLLSPDKLDALDYSIDKLIAYKKRFPDMITNSVRHLVLIKEYFRGTLSYKDVWPCYAGYNRLQITQDYVIYFCVPPESNCSTSFGDVSKDSLRKLWFSSEAHKRRKLIRKCKAPCLQCCSYRDDFPRLSETVAGWLGKTFGKDGKG